jgi:di/tricarboxylate transporter
MSLEIILIFIILIVAIVLFTTERVSFDITALLVMSSLMLCGILSPAEALSGFSNEATITIGAMFVLSEGMRRTGTLDIMGDFFSRMGQQNYFLALLTMMLVMGLISAFINNTAAVAIFIPIVLAVGYNLNISPSKLLMPLSFASMFGGVCTLLGTSTNILISSIAEEYGQSPFAMFEFAPLGLIFFGVGLVYLFFIGIRLIPERGVESEATNRFEINAYLTDVILEPDFTQFGQTVTESDLTRNLDLDVVQIFRKDGTFSTEGPETILQQGDVLRVRGSAQEIKRLVERDDISLKPARKWFDVDFEKGSGTLVEAIISPDADVVGQALANVDFPTRFGAIVLAIRHHGQLHQDEMEQIRLSGGDSVLLSMARDRIDDIKATQAFVVVSELGFPDQRKDKMLIALAILLGVIAVATFTPAPIVLSAIIGCILLVIFGCLTVEEAHSALNWKIILLLAGLIPLGIAMEKTGTAELIANAVLSVGSGWGPTVILSLFFFLAMMLTNFISNQATAVLLAPIAIQVAQTLAVNPRPFLMAVTFAASLSFMTPVGYQTNTLIYGPGQYKFTDFTKVGTPLNLLFWLIATLLIPFFWPF